MEKIKLSSYAKKGVKGQEEHSYNHSVIEEPQTNQGKFLKYLPNYIDKLKRVHSKWKKFRSLDKILRRYRLLLRSITLTSYFESLAGINRKIFKCSNSSTYKATKFKNLNTKWPS